MLELTDEALQRLYWACRRQEDFPGVLPNELRGIVTTNDILAGLGLAGPDFIDSDAGSLNSKDWETPEEETQIALPSHFPNAEHLPNRQLRPLPMPAANKTRTLVSPSTSHPSLLDVPSLSHEPSQNSSLYILPVSPMPLEPEPEVRRKVAAVERTSPTAPVFHDRTNDKNNEPNTELPSQNPISKVAAYMSPPPHVAMDFTQPLYLDVFYDINKWPDTIAPGSPTFHTTSNL